MAVDETLTIPWPADGLTEADCQQMERLCLPHAHMWKAAASSVSIQSTSAASPAGKTTMVVCDAAPVTCLQSCHRSIAIRVLCIVCQYSHERSLHVIRVHPHEQPRQVCDSLHKLV